MPPKRKATMKAAADSNVATTSTDPSTSIVKPTRSTRSRGKAKAVVKDEPASDDEDVKQPPSKRAKSSKTAAKDADDEDTKDAKDEQKMVRADEPMPCSI